MKMIPGSSSYADIAKNGKKICIFSDSICKRFKMRDFSNSVDNGRAFLKSFTGSTARQLHHYVLPTLIEQTPDIAVIHVGTNSMRTRAPIDTANDIVKIVERCHEQGVNDVYVSSIIIRPGFEKEVETVNQYLEADQGNYGFTFINNKNITLNNLWKDRVHLNDRGVNILQENFALSLNKKFTGSS